MVSEWLLIMTNMMKGGGTEARTCGGGEDPYSPWLGQVGGGGDDDGGGGGDGGGDDGSGDDDGDDDGGGGGPGVRMRAKMMMVRVFSVGCGTNIYL